MKENSIIKSFVVLLFSLLVVTGSEIIASANDESYIVKFSDKAEIVNFMSEVDDALSKRGIYEVTNLEDIQWYIDNGLVEYIEPNYDVELFGEISDELYNGQWYHSMIKSSTAWDLSTYGNGVNVGIIDSGCYSHEDISNNVLTGYNVLSSSSDVSDTIGHGTHVSGIVAAELNATGIVGIAHKANIIPIKCFDSSVSTKVKHVVAAIYSAVDDYDCKILNMSWGLSTDAESLREAIQYAHEKGVILVAAVGNKGTDVLYYPASYDCVIGVGAVDYKQNICDFSQYNNSVMIVAPGKNVLSLGNSNNSYVTMNGTSQAAPMVTSLISILLNIDEDLTFYDIKDCLINTSTDLGDSSYDVYYGYGLLNIENAINYYLQNLDYYLSPITLNSDKVSVLVYNNTSEVLTCNLISSFYTEENGFLNCDITDVQIESNNKIEYSLGSPNDYYTVKCFLWSDLNSLRPLVSSRSKGD